MIDQLPFGAASSAMNRAWEESGSQPLNSARQSLWLQSLLNDLAFGVVLLGPTLRPCFFNVGARSSLESIGILGLFGGQALGHCKQTQAFMEGARLALRGKRSMLLLGEDQLRVATAFSPIALGRADETGVLVTTERSEVCEAISLWAYGKILGLTASEARVLEKLALGVEPKLIATQFEVSLATVRTHIKAVLAKTHSQNIRELLLKIARLPPIRTLSSLA